MNKAVEEAKLRKSPFYVLQRFIADRPEVIETPLMRCILPETLKHNVVATIRAIEVQGHIIDKLILTYFSLYRPNQTLRNMDTTHKQEMLELMISDLEQNPEHIQKLFTLTEHKHITSESRYDDFIPRIVSYVRNCVDKSIAKIRIIDVGCAPQTVLLGAPALEKLIRVLRENFPQTKFEVIGTDATMSVDILESAVIGAQGICYVQDNIEHSVFSEEKFDVVIFNRVPLFNGITKNSTARDQGLETLRKMSSQGLFLFDSFTGDTMLMFYKGKLQEAFVHADDDLIRRMMFRSPCLNVAFSMILDYSNLPDLSRLAALANVSVDRLIQNIQMYLQVMLFSYLEPSASEDIKTWFTQGCIGPCPQLIPRSETEAFNCLQKLQVQWQAELKKIRSLAMTKEQQNEYPWMELSLNTGTAIGAQIVAWAIANSKKAQKFFSELMFFVVTHHDKKMVQRIQAMLQLS